MNAEGTLLRLRQFLIIISAGVFVMTVAELTFLAHWSETIQYLPFVLSGLGLVTLVLAYFRPTRSTLLILRWAMILIAACSLIGFYEHMENNYEFQKEIQPSSTMQELILATLEGANPVLAPGILTLGGVIGLAATYQHDVLGKNKVS
jgi:hypothetical protein